MATPLISPVVTIHHPDTGLPLSLGKVYAYASGTTTPKATYADEGKQTQNAHPVVLNGAGQGDIYLEGEYKIVVKDSDDAQIYEWDPVSDFDPDVDEWLSSISATYVSPSSFTVSGDRTAVFSRGRPIKLTDGSTIIAHVDSSSYSSPDTTVTIYSSTPITASLAFVQPGITTTPPLSTLASGIAMAGGRTSGTRTSAIFCCDGPSGGTSDFLDGIDGLTGGPIVNGQATPLQDGDIAYVGSESGDSVTTYILDEDSGQTPDGVGMVAPATNPGLKRWKRKKSYIDQTEVLQAVYPVGIIISTYTNTNPATTFGFGTWEQWGVGRVPVCVDSGDADFDAAGDTGGAKTVTLTAVQSGVPAHTHTTGENSVDHTHTGTTSSNGDHNHSIPATSEESDSDQGYSSFKSGSGKTTGNAGTHNHTLTTGGVSANHTHPVNVNLAEAAAQAHDNMPPFVAEYRWRRTA